VRDTDRDAIVLGCACVPVIALVAVIGYAAWIAEVARERGYGGPLTQAEVLEHDREGLRSEWYCREHGTEWPWERERCE
jgi:hypothetical protein